MNLVKSAIRKIVRRSGFDVVRFQMGQLGDNPFCDMQHFLKGTGGSPVILDIGANIGQTIDKFMDLFPEAIIHSFEPSPATYEKLKVHCGNLSGVKAWNYGVGSDATTLSFNENDHSDMSSFLLPNAAAWGKVVNSIDVQVVTLDSFARDQKIDYIHILKSDTQGYELEVFKGASQLMAENRIGMIYVELTFSDMYINAPPFDAVIRYLIEQNFALVCIYKQNFQNELASWTDALFINKDFKSNRF